MAGSFDNHWMRKDDEVQVLLINNLELQN